MAVLLETSVGDLVIDLKVDQAPKTCTNFLKLCKIKYYHNCLFFNVQKNYIVQTGDPTNTGRGGAAVFAKLPGLTKRYIDDEILPIVKHNVKGTVAMANERPNENGSRFYITLRDKIEHLDGKHTIFGVVAEGLDTLEKINNAMLDDRNAPFQNIRILHTEVLEDPFPDPEGLQPLIPSKSPEPIRDEVFKKIEDEEDEAELKERVASALAKSQSTTLELLHDLPDADIAPPDNDLFVANLNPVTQDGDLELIFSRFGAIKSCEIVRDWKTGDSLQYAFITFEEARHCEEAYLKMHDCVIDDRRVFINFSQSVAKLWNKWRTGSRISKEDVQNADKGKGKGGKGKGKGGPRIPRPDAGSAPSSVGATSRRGEERKAGRSRSPRRGGSRSPRRRMRSTERSPRGRRR